MCTVSQEAGTLGDLSAWTLQGSQVERVEYWAHAGLLYFDFLFLYNGLHQESGGSWAIYLNLERFPFDVAASNLAQVLGQHSSGAEPLTTKRAYFSISRIFSALIAIGGVNESVQTVPYVESTKQ